ncbi:MAG: hypothetical protein DRI71_09235 [Bacteroidetes bacterium]|nr:MAG: hypothetical protein DRI71_09235 [Bacteroidota bacterium]
MYYKNRTIWAYSKIVVLLAKATKIFSSFFILVRSTLPDTPGQQPAFTLLLFHLPVRISRLLSIKNLTFKVTDSR